MCEYGEQLPTPKEGLWGSLSGLDSAQLVVGGHTG